jgi:hypothetical protein
VKQETKTMPYHFRDFRYEIPKQSRLEIRIFWGMLVVLGILLLAASPTQAQTRRDVEREIEKTEAVINRAADAVSASRNLKAENLLVMAKEFQGQAKGQAHMARYGLALKLTLKAREKAYQAIGFTKRDEENESLVIKAMEKTDQLILQAQEAAGGTENRRALSLLEMAITQQERAKDFFREHKLKMALKFTLKAREAAQKAQELAGDGERSSRLCEKQLQAALRLFDKASAVVAESQNQGATALMEKAQGFLNRAQDRFNQNAFALSINDSQSAIEMVENALELVEEDVTPQTAENAIQQNESLIKRGEEAMSGQVSTQAMDIFKKGLSHQSQAKEYHHQGRYKAALEEAKVAHRLLNQALQMVEESDL